MELSRPGPDTEDGTEWNWMELSTALNGTENRTGGTASGTGKI